MSYYIHLDDPGFPAAPWPGQRRLGKFDTHEEAVAQAVADAASGHGIAAGIYDEESSETLGHGGRAAAFMARSEIKRRGEVEARRRAKVAALEAASEEERDKALQAFLPEGVTVADLREQGVIR